MYKLRPLSTSPPPVPPPVPPPSLLSTQSLTAHSLTTAPLAPQAVSQVILLCSASFFVLELPKKIPAPVPAISNQDYLAHKPRNHLSTTTTHHLHHNLPTASVSFLPPEPVVFWNKCESKAKPPVLSRPSFFFSSLPSFGGTPLISSLVLHI